jgi:Zn-dependent peptidase ImmA (M78 family)
VTLVWTSEQDDLLRKHFRTKSSKELARELGVSDDSVRRRFVQLGLRRTQHSPEAIAKRLAGAAARREREASETAVAKKTPWPKVSSTWEKALGGRTFDAIRLRQTAAPPVVNAVRSFEGSACGNSMQMCEGM